MTRILILAEPGFCPYEAEQFTARGAAVSFGPPEKDLPPGAGEAQVILFTRTVFTRNVLLGLPRLRVLARFGIGLDTVDVDAASDLGVYVCNTPTFSVEDVATHALALLLAVNNHVAGAHAVLRAGGWGNGGGAPARRLAGKTLGLIGCGRIARSLCRQTACLGLRYVGYDPFVSPEALAGLPIELVSLEELACRSDFVSCHAPLTQATRHMLGGAFFARMKPTALFINTSRGGLVDEAALVGALEEGRIGGAGLDVFEQEPLPPDSPLRALPGVVLTPHIAYNTVEAAEDLHREITGNILAYMETGVPGNAVNARKAALNIGKRGRV